MVDDESLYSKEQPVNLPPEIVYDKEQPVFANISQSDGSLCAKEQPVKQSPGNTDDSLYLNEHPVSPAGDYDVVKNVQPGPKVNNAKNESNLKTGARLQPPLGMKSSMYIREHYLTSKSKKPQRKPIRSFRCGQC